MRLPRLGLALAFVAAGCASGGRPAAPGAPTTAGLVDTAALAAALSAQSAKYRVTATYAVSFTPQGSVDSFSLVRSSGTEAIADSMGKILRAHLRPPAHVQRGRLLAIRVDTAGAPLVSVRPTAMVGAVLQNPGQVADDLQRSASGRALSGTGVIWVQVGKDGGAVKTRVLTSSGMPALDQLAQEAASGGRFRPCSIEGEPVACWVKLPLAVR